MHDFKRLTYAVKIVWMLGNLARATYVGSSDYMWPYSYNRCDSRTRISQEIDACAKVNHYGMQAYTGRGAPEIDIIEAMQGEAGKLPSTYIQRPYQSTSLQIAPGVEIDRPILGKRPHEVSWNYEIIRFGIEYSHLTFGYRATGTKIWIMAIALMSPSTSIRSSTASPWSTSQSNTRIKPTRYLPIYN